MKPKAIITTFLILCFTLTVQAQFLRKLKQKAEEAAERTILRKTDEAVSKKTEKTIDDATTKKDKSSNDNADSSENQSVITSSNSALNKNTEFKNAFYKEDAVIKLHENGKLTQTQYFDANEVAVKMEQDDQPKPGFLDSEGFMYGYNEREGQYNKSSLIASSSQGIMVPTMMIEAYKLPPEPFMANLQKQQDQDVTPNPFNGIVEFAFVYEPEQFRYDDFKETKQSRAGKTYTKFEFLNEPGYEGSYVLFDNKDRLVEIYTNKKATGQSMDAFSMDMMPPGESLITYEYKPVDVKLPPAKEVKAQGQDLMGMVYGSFNKNKNPEDIDEDDYDTSDSKGQIKSVKTALKNHKVTVNDLPDAYNFDWIFKTEMAMESRKKDIIDMNFLLRENAKYQGSEIVDRKNKDMGKVTIVFDLELNTMIMFMDGSGHKMLQMFPIPEPKKTNEKLDFKITQLPSKTILGYTCKGLQMENEKYILQVYHATGTPISLSNFLTFSGSKNMELPEIDPRIAKQFSEGLIMEMHITDKKKSKNSMTITAKALDKVPTSFKKDDYQSMDMLSGMRMFNNK
tara:strand:+ start:28738 stop:30441 length:1704 start_codon:yes stop_codon:yes gene_type:complete